MKSCHLCSSFWGLIGIASVGLILAPETVQAQERRFSCGQTNGVPTTLAKTKRGHVPVIQWTSDYFAQSDWTPEKRCQRVSGLFEQYYRAGSLNYLTTGWDRKTSQNVVCVAAAEEKNCTGTLFTLKPGSNPGQTLKQLMDLRVRATNKVLNETHNRVYVNMDEFLQTRPVVPAGVGGTAEPLTSDESKPPAPPVGGEEIW